MQPCGEALETRGTLQTQRLGGGREVGGPEQRPWRLELTGSRVRPRRQGWMAGTSQTYILWATKGV